MCGECSIDIIKARKEGIGNAYMTDQTVHFNQLASALP